MPKYKVIVNPTSGRGTAGEKVPQIEALFQGHGLDFDLVRTERVGHAIDLAQEAVTSGYDVVVSAGGDGTANEVLNGLMLAKKETGKTAAMAILCIGRGNDFGYGMEVPAELEEGCRVVAQDHRRLVDVGWVAGGLYPEGRYFGNGIGLGFDAVVGFEAVKMTRLHGFLSYIVATLKTVFLYYKAPLVKLEFDDQMIELPALMISVMNGRRMGGGFMMAPEGKTDDGLFDLCIVREVSRLRIFGLVPHFMNGTQAGQEPVRMERAKRLVATAIKGVLPAHADGETLCTEGERLEAELLAGQIEMVCQVPGNTA